MMNKVTPVLLAGGSGTRLWPLSRKSYPKQFVKLFGEHSLFQKSALRLASSDKVSFQPHFVLTSSDFRFIVAEQLEIIGFQTNTILIEPEVKNTSPAILAASLSLFEQDEDMILLVAPSDHIIINQQEFHQAIALGLKEVLKSKVVTFGITPTYPETGYGYLQINNQKGITSKKVERFIEKPEQSVANEMFKSGNFLWNSGIFMFRAKDMISMFKKMSPKTYINVKESVNNSDYDLKFVRLHRDHWSKLKNESIDYAIMEKANNLVAVPFHSKWSDLGGWDAVWKDMDKDSNGVALTPNSYSIDCKNTLLRTESNQQQLVGLGLENIIAVAMPDAVLVANKDKAQDVKKVVTILNELNISASEFFPKDYRPWGWFESLILTETFQVKRIHVNPKASLSLQSHKYRSEHWVVVKGIAKVTIDSEVKLLYEGESVFVPVGAIHRLENPSKKNIMVLIEVQTGTYFGEDDIIRYEDKYKR